MAFCRGKLTASRPISKALISELESLDHEMKSLTTERPKLKAYLVEQEGAISELTDRIQLKAGGS